MFYLRKNNFFVVTYITNRVGPNMDPCGTSVKLFVAVAITVWIFYTILSVFLNNLQIIIADYMKKIPISSRVPNNYPRSIVSNAFELSINNIGKCIFFYIN